jgi:hypothetical protein
VLSRGLGETRDVPVRGWWSGVEEKTSIGVISLYYEENFIYFISFIPD